MRIACLQFAPQVGDVDNNLNRADSVLNRATIEDIDLMVLPELAFSGYNFRSLQHISPYLEPTTAGITSLWARTVALKYNCTIACGYAERVDISNKWPASPEYYNSLMVVNAEGETIANYHKSFLYHTDETWALEGTDGFWHGSMGPLGNVAMGICMDLNPYKFSVPWTAWEFAHHILYRQANLVILSMAWLTREDAGSFSRMPKEPDMDTLSYWISRLEPLIRNEGEEEIICVFANRCGTEDDAVYAGTSAVLGIQAGEVKVYGILGRGERELLVVDTSEPPKYKLRADLSDSAEQNTITNNDTEIHEVMPLSASSTSESERSLTSHSSVSKSRSSYEPLASVISRPRDEYTATTPVAVDDLIREYFDDGDDGDDDDMNGTGSDHSYPTPVAYSPRSDRFASTNSIHQTQPRETSNLDPPLPGDCDSIDSDAAKKDPDERNHDSTSLQAQLDSSTKAQIVDSASLGLAPCRYEIPQLPTGAGQPFMGERIGSGSQGPPRPKSAVW